MTVSYGDMNGAMIGSLMRECVARAIRLIRNKRFTFLPTKKGTKANGQPDWVTDADTEAQIMYANFLRERFPQFGIVGEEDELSVPCTHPTENFWFSVDPLDGTAAYKRVQSHGIGTMLALMHNDVVIAVAIGDVMTGEIYYYRPASRKTHRLDVFQHDYKQVLSVDVKIPLSQQYVLLRDPVEKHSVFGRSLVQMHPHPLFHSHEITGGSIGISMARLWKGEVGAVILRPGKQTPWDSCPVLGISKRLGFVSFSITPVLPNEHAPVLKREDPKPVAHTYQIGVETLVIHESRIPELQDWCTHEGFNIEL